MGAGVSARYVRSLTERSTGRISGRFGVTGAALCQHDVCSFGTIRFGMFLGTVLPDECLSFPSTGVELEAGASRRIARSASAGMYVSVGLTVRAQTMNAD